MIRILIYQKRKIRIKNGYINYKNIQSGYRVGILDCKILLMKTRNWEATEGIKLPNVKRIRTKRYERKAKKRIP